MPIAYSYVRFSSEGQRGGNSVERQTKAAREWAEKNGYALSTDTFEDLGVSAFRGGNAAEGRLGEFLEAARSGAIPKGSVLVVENLDRISRDKIRNARNTLENIIDAGVDVVTLSDGRVYTQHDLDEDAMTGIMIILSFQRANEESAIKSKRVGAAWKSNAEKVKAGGRKRTTKVPAWIEFKGRSLEDGSFEVIEEKAEVVREIFRRYADGEATNTIANDLRNRGVPTLSGRGQWTGPLLYMLSREVTPYGTLRIGKGRKQDREIVDEVRGYYPRIISDEIERRVRHRIASGAAPMKVNLGGECRGRLVGVLRSPEGNGCKAKRNNRSTSYVDRVTNKFLGTVSIVDQVLIDEWPEVVKAFGVETSIEAEGLEQELLAAIDTLESLQAQRQKRSGAAIDRLILAAEAEVEEIRRNIQSASKSTRIYGAVPSEIVLLPIPEANAWVRRLIEEARLFREGSREASRVSIWLRLKNGVVMSIGDASVGLQAR
jgi:DNA invertase Pin-like site-specific DNA recombinase